MVKEEDVYPVETVVRIKKTGLFALIKGHAYQSGNYGFLHYRGEIEGRDGEYCIFHQDVELECLPGKQIFLDQNAHTL